MLYRMTLFQHERGFNVVLRDISLNSFISCCRKNSGFKVAKSFLLDRARAIKYRQENNEAVGGFFTQIGELYVVHHLWGMSFFGLLKFRANF